MTVRTTVLALLVATSLVGCSGESPTPDTSESRAPYHTIIQVSYDDFLNQNQISRKVTIAVGDTLFLNLGSNASTGFQWTEKLLISDPQVMTQTSHKVIPPVERMPGAAGAEVWTLEAKKKGNTTVSSTYGRPWPEGEKDAWVFSVNVSVE